MAQPMIHSDFMHSVLSSGVANVSKNDLIDGILLYVAFDDAVSPSPCHYYSATPTSSLLLLLLIYVPCFYRAMSRRSQWLWFVNSGWVSFYLI